MFQRALARAGIPMRYSEGFNPRPRISLPLPRPVGIASDDELLVLEMQEPLACATVAEKLGTQLPPQIAILSATRIADSARFIAGSVRYRLCLGADSPPDLEARIERLKTAKTLEVSRYSPKRARTRQVDIKPYLDDIVRAGDVVEFRLVVKDGASARPGEIGMLLGLDAKAVNHLVCRTEIRWQQEH